jgi:hypothetical protein
MTDEERARLRCQRFFQAIDRESSVGWLPESQRRARAANTLCDEEVNRILHDNFVACFENFTCNEHDRACRRVCRDDTRRIDVRRLRAREV